MTGVGNRHAAHGRHSCWRNGRGRRRSGGRPTRISPRQPFPHLSGGDGGHRRSTGGRPAAASGRSIDRLSRRGPPWHRPGPKSGGRLFSASGRSRWRYRATGDPMANENRTFPANENQTIGARVRLPRPGAGVLDHPVALRQPARSRRRLRRRTMRESARARSQRPRAPWRGAGGAPGPASRARGRHAGVMQGASATASARWRQAGARGHGGR